MRLQERTEVLIASRQLKTLAHSVSQKIINALAEMGRCTVTELYMKIRTEQALVSYQLAWLRQAGVVRCYKDGKYRIYSLVHERLKEFIKVIEALNQEG